MSFKISNQVIGVLSGDCMPSIYAYATVLIKDERILNN